MEKQTDSKNFTKTSAFGECLWKGLIYVLLIIWAGIVLFPFYWMVLTSLKSYGSYNAEHIPAFFTASPTLENYADAFTAVPLGRYLLNTVVFTTITTALMMMVIVPGSLCFCQACFSGEKSDVYPVSFPDDDSQ